MKKIYKTKNGSYFKMLRPVGSWNSPDRKHYALWKQVTRYSIFGIIFYIPCNNIFWLDTEGFERVKNE